MTKEILIKNLIQRRVLQTPEIIEAFMKIDRADFVLPKYKDQAYEDYPLPIGFDATISQPTTVAVMLEMLNPQKGDKILDVGSGSGWTTALLKELVGPDGEVWGTEIVPKLVDFGMTNLSKYNFNKTHIIQAEKTIGCQKRSPYDKILVSASAKELPEELISQLKNNGRMVIPILNSIWKIDKRANGILEKQEYPGFVFVPLQQT